MAHNDLRRRSAQRTRDRLVHEPARPWDGPAPKGTLLVIGGAEDKDREKVILRRLVMLVGSGKLVVATVASEDPRQSFERYEPLLRSLGAPHIHHLNVETRGQATQARTLRVLEDADAVFFTGGDQLRITAVLGDTPVFSRIYEIFAQGGTIAGTSAGAAVMSETMVVGGNGEKSYRVGGDLQMAPGFGFARHMVIDQHFAERGRIGRLAGVVAQNPRMLGVGIDEDTAIEVERGASIRVLGAGGVTILDGSTITHTNVAEVDTGRTLSVMGVRLHILSQGDELDLLTREPIPRPPEEVEEELGVPAGSANGA
jgi:cyanophycinase